MKVKLTQRARIWHNAGETVEVSPEEAAFLVGIGAATPVRDAKKETPEKKGKAREKA